MSGLKGLWSGISGNGGAALLGGCAVLALGLGVGAAVLANGMVRMRQADREVTVRGVAEREVTANRARWEVGYSQAAFALPEALAAVDRDTATIRAYLRDKGFAGEVTAPGSAEVSVSDEMIDNKPTGRKVYTVRRAIAFTTDQVKAVQQVQAGKDRLAQQGLVVDSVGATYEYTQLDTIKPEIIADATRDARGAAEKFADDSGAAVGGIRSATQGYFSVSSRDAGGSDDEGGSSRTADTPDQKVRVVTTIAYYLD